MSILHVASYANNMFKSEATQCMPLIMYCHFHLIYEVFTLREVSLLVRDIIFVVKHVLLSSDYDLVACIIHSAMITL